MPTLGLMSYLTVFRIKRWSECTNCKICQKTCQWGAIEGPRILVSECVRFARQAGYRTITLWTNNVLHAARHLYEQAGFRLVQEADGAQWGTRVWEQVFELEL